LRIEVKPGSQIEPARLFADRPADVWLEIGFGGGEHLAQLASLRPDIGFIGAEPFLNGVAKLLSVIAASGLANIRIVDGDARPLVAQLADAAIGRVFVLYPDPWPKRRHEKRRLFNAAFIAELHRIMKPDAELRLATDSPDYAGWSLRNILRHGGFDWLAEKAAAWRQPPPEWVETRYESKAIRQGRKPIYLRFRKLA
jgi:tRNA (guanine-N7-)-methyltransferase